MLFLQDKTSSLSYLKRAVKASKDKNVFKDEKLSLVGVAYSNTLMDTMLVEPVLEDIEFFLEDKEKVFGTSVLLRPMPRQVDSLETFRNLVAHTSKIVFPEDLTIKQGLEKAPFDANFKLADSLVSNIQTYKVHLEFTDPDVFLIETKLNGENLYQFTIEDSFLLGSEEIKHQLVVVFTPKKYDDDNIFTYLVDEADYDGAIRNKINKRDTSKVLDLLNVPNVTGKYIMGAWVTPKYNSFEVTSYPYKEDTQIAIGEDTYYIMADTAGISFSYESIKYARITRKTGDKYLLSVFLADGSVNIALG